MPIDFRGSDKRNIPWNVEEIKSVIHGFPGVCVAYLAGHCHRGGNFKDEHGIVNITLPGIIEVKPGSASYATVQVFEKKLIIDVVNDSERFKKKIFEIEL